MSLFVTFEKLNVSLLYMCVCVCAFVALAAKIMTIHFQPEFL